MKRYIYVILLLVIWTACAEDKELGPDLPVDMDYELPQGLSPDDDRVVELFDKYGSYFLYSYTNEDFNWAKVVSSSTLTKFSAILGDPRYVGDMLDVLDDIWFRFYSDDFMKRCCPYRVFLADSIREDYQNYYRVVYHKTRLSENTISIAGLNKDISSISGINKKKLQNELQRNFIMDLLNSKKLDIPTEFYKVSDYSTAATRTTDQSVANSPRNRGFVPSIDYEDLYGSVSEWCTNVDYYTKRLKESDDLGHYLKNMLCHGMDEPNSWGAYLKFPLVKKKYDILREHFIKVYNIDLNRIGSASY